jgi:hypothetical protein
LKLERKKSKKIIFEEPCSPKNGDFEDGKGNLIAYNDDNTITIDYKDVDGDGKMDTLSVGADNRVSYKT